MKDLWNLHSIKLIEQNVSDERFIEYARVISRHSPSLILLSGSDHDSALYSITCWNPWCVVSAKGLFCRFHQGSFCKVFKGNPLDELCRVMDSFSINYPMEIPPFIGGAVGYIAYELKNTIERLPQQAKDDLFLPDLFFFFPQEIILHHRKTGELFYVAVGPCKDRSIGGFTEIEKMDPEVSHGNNVYNWRSNFSRSEYIKAIERIINYIRDGHVYQVNLSQRYSFNFEGDLFELWVRLFRRNPAPFYAFFNNGSYKILSTSMERFLFIKDGVIETRPIKGTRPRGKSPAEDLDLVNDLLSNPKDGAELSMIVDLLRNDLGKICQPGSVHVAEHKRIESYQNVHHLISIVRGRLQEALSYSDILKATFPGGSITGCPKIRAMEIIDELEPNVRHVYTGSIGYLGFHGNMDVNIAIRTMITLKETDSWRCFLSVGGGIVYDSDPELEYEETLHKGRTFFELLQGL
ncbi:MAG: aminodeoxychorismate synthase component I [Syntrophobacterales bacterium]|nr:aminodeoxychorismate synthase component I [Syntrophobacterales bacterium]